MRFFPLCLLMGCAPAVIVHDYPKLGIKINQTNKTIVHRECGSENEACAYPGLKPCEIWVYNASDILHEVCHCDGGNEERCKGDEW